MGKISLTIKHLLVPLSVSNNIATYAGTYPYFYFHLTSIIIIYAYLLFVEKI